MVKYGVYSIKFNIRNEVFMKIGKWFCSLGAALAFLPLFAADPADADPFNGESVKVVFFPFREALIASRIDGVVLKNHFKIGERFKQGDQLVALDDIRFRIELARVEALLKESEAVASFAKTTLANQKDMYEQKMLSELEYKKAQLDVETSAARLLAVKANLKDVQNQLTYCVVSAPFPGRVEEILTRDYETVRGGQPLLRVIDDNRLKAVMFIPVSAMPLMTLGREISVQIPVLNRSAKAVIYEIAPRADHRSGTIEIRAAVDNPDGVFTAGMTGVLNHAQSR